MREPTGVAFGTGEYPEALQRGPRRFHSAQRSSLRFSPLGKGGQVIAAEHAGHLMRVILPTKVKR
jgi:hypothetical protein